MSTAFRGPRKPRPRTSPPPMGLTPHMAGIASCLLDGMTNAETAAAMGIAKTTLDTHLDAMKSRLMARNTRALVVALARMEMQG